MPGSRPTAGRSPRRKDSGNPSSGKQSSQQTQRQGQRIKSSAGSKKARTPAGSRSLIASRPAARRDRERLGRRRSEAEKPQPGGEEGKGETARRRQAAEPEKKQPGSQGAGDEKQLAQGGPKPDDKKPSGSGGSEARACPAERSRGKSPRTRKRFQGGGQGSKSKPEEKQAAADNPAAVTKPKSGQGEQEGSSGGGKKPSGDKPSGSKSVPRGRRTAAAGSRQERRVGPPG